MTTRGFNIITVLTIQSFIFHQSHGFNVTQPQNRTVNPDGITSISCEYTADEKERGSSVQDVRLNGISPGGASPKILCQKGQKDCHNIIMRKENPQKYIFIILNIGPEAMSITYQCEFTLTMNDLDTTETGSPTTLQAGLESPHLCSVLNQTKPEDSVSTHPAHPLHDAHTFWILIGLLALTTLYCCIITGGYVKLRMTQKLNNNTTTDTRELDNSTYVEMRKANPSYNIYRG